LRDQASDDVGSAAGNGANDKANRPGWIGLCPGMADGRRQAGRPRSQT